MKIFHLSHADIGGGAARAAYRIHQALRDEGIDSTMFVNEAAGGDWTVNGPTGKLNKAFSRIRPHVGNLLVKSLRTQNGNLHSPAVLSSSWVKRINASDADVVHLHWVQGEMLSVADIGRIKKPIVWTLHDMWAFCGAEHYTDEERWRSGYAAANRPDFESGFDLNRWTFARKRKHWHSPMHIVAPSRWLAGCARESALMRGWPVSVIPNTINTNAWQPIDKVLARKLLHLPPDVPLLLFGAMGGTHEPRKGFDLLQSALNHLRGRLPGLELLVFGQLAPEVAVDIGFPMHYAGHLHDDVSLRILYSAADALAIPSRQDNLPNTGVESHACGTPVIAFDTCGLPDITSHKETGYLAAAFDTADFAAGLVWVLDDASRRAALGKTAQARAVELWSNPVVARQYLQVYKMLEL